MKERSRKLKFKGLNASEGWGIKNAHPSEGWLVWQYRGIDLAANSYDSAKVESFKCLRGEA